LYNDIVAFTVFDETAADTNKPTAQQEKFEENQENRSVTKLFCLSACLFAFLLVYLAFVCLLGIYVCYFLLSLFRPPYDYVKEKTNRPIMGILQPSHGIPVCPLENNDEDDEMCDEVNENQPPAGSHNKQNDINNRTTCDVTEDPNNYLTSFKTAARMASTPYAQGMEPPSFVLSTIKPPKLDNDDGSALHSNDFAANSFACTPSKALSPIFERSDEDVKSVASSASSTASSGRGSVSQHISNAIKLESIVEDPRSFTQAQKPDLGNEHQTLPDQHMQYQLARTLTEPYQSFYETAMPQFEDPRTHPDERPDYQTVSDVSRRGLDGVDGRIQELNPFSDDVTYQLLSTISPPVSSYSGYFSCDEYLPNIAERMAIDLGRFVYQDMAE